MIQTLAATFAQLRVRTPRVLAIAIVVCTLPMLLTVGVTPLSAQASSKRLVHVAVTDPFNRFVTGLGQGGFEIVENGVRRTITEFSGPESPLSLAIVSETPVTPLNGFNGPGDELIQTRSLADALRQLSSSKNSRRALVITTSADTQAMPAGIALLQTTPDNLPKALVEVRNQYVLQFASSSPAGPVDIILKPPRGLPLLRANYK